MATLAPRRPRGAVLTLVASVTALAAAVSLYPSLLATPAPQARAAQAEARRAVTGSVDEASGADADVVEAVRPNPMPVALAEASPEPTPLDYRALLSGSAGADVAGLFGLDVGTIVVDAGHGGKDPGAIGPAGTREKALTLDIARRLAARLRARGAYRVLMTRTRDETLSLKDRVELANSKRADLFISIHINHLPVEALTVVETYYFGPHSDPRALQLAKRENAGSGYGMMGFKEVIHEIGDTVKRQESRRLARYIQTSLVTRMRARNEDLVGWGIKTAPFVVLLGVEAPAVLAEVTSLNNPEEERRLGSKAYRAAIASYLEAGIVRYLSARSETQQLTTGDIDNGTTVRKEDG